MKPIRINQNLDAYIAKLLGNPQPQSGGNEQRGGGSHEYMDRANSYASNPDYSQKFGGGGGGGKQPPLNRPPAQDPPPVPPAGPFVGPGLGEMDKQNYNHVMSAMGESGPVSNPFRDGLGWLALGQSGLGMAAAHAAKGQNPFAPMQYGMMPGSWPFQSQEKAPPRPGPMNPAIKELGMPDQNNAMPFNTPAANAAPGLPAQPAAAVAPRTPGLPVPTGQGQGQAAANYGPSPTPSWMTSAYGGTGTGARVVPGTTPTTTPTGLPTAGTGTGGDDRQRDKSLETLMANPDAGTGGGTGAPAKPKHWSDEWMPIAQMKGIDWDVLVNTYLNPKRKGTWGKYESPHRDIAAAIRDAEEDGLWAEIFAQFTGSPPNETEWNEHWYAKQYDYKNDYYRDPILNDGHNQAVAEFNRRAMEMSDEESAQGSQDYINDLPPGAMW